MSLHICKAICLDEIDRSYLSELNRLFSFFSHTHQTLLFHSSFQSAMLEDTRKWLSDPIVINATQRDEIRCDIQYDVEYVKENERNVFIVRSCLNKTAPPVLIVCRSEKNVDFLHEYFLLKGIDTVSMTSSMSPQEKSRALQTFRDKKADVLVCTDSSLGAESLPEVRHVIHFDLPSESRFFVNRLKSLRPKGISTAPYSGSSSRARSLSRAGHRSFSPRNRSKDTTSQLSSASTSSRSLRWVHSASGPANTWPRMTSCISPFTARAGTPPCAS